MSLEVRNWRGGIPERHGLSGEEAGKPEGPGGLGQVEPNGRDGRNVLRLRVAEFSKAKKTDPEKNLIAGKGGLKRRIGCTQGRELILRL